MEQHVFKRKVDKYIVIASAFTLIPVSWLIFSIIGLIHPDGMPYYIFLITTPLCLFFVAFCFKRLRKTWTTIFIIDDEKIVQKDFLAEKEFKWAEIGDIKYQSTVVNSIQTSKYFTLLDNNDKTLIDFPCPTEKSFTGNEKLEDIILTFFNISRR